MVDRQRALFNNTPVHTKEPTQTLTPHRFPTTTTDFYEQSANKESTCYDLKRYNDKLKTPQLSDLKNRRDFEPILQD